MNYFESAKAKLIEWAHADESRIGAFYSKIGTLDIGKFCDWHAYEPDIIQTVARMMNATDEEIAKINEFSKTN